MLAEEDNNLALAAEFGPRSDLLQRALAWFRDFSDCSLSRNRTEVDLPPTSLSSAPPSMTVAPRARVCHELCRAGLDGNRRGGPGVLHPD